jgi:hypothetical protein
VDETKLDWRFPVGTIKSVKEKLMELGKVLDNYEEVSRLTREINPLCREFFTDRYKRYRKVVNHTERMNGANPPRQ